MATQTNLEFPSIDIFSAADTNCPCIRITNVITCCIVHTRVCECLVKSNFVGRWSRWRLEATNGVFFLLGRRRVLFHKKEDWDEKSGSSDLHVGYDDFLL